MTTKYQSLVDRLGNLSSRLEKSQIGTWHVVLNGSDTVLAVYGSALIEEANKAAGELFPLAHVETWVNEPKPFVGQQAY